MTVSGCPSVQVLAGGCICSHHHDGPPLPACSATVSPPSLGRWVRSASCGRRRWVAGSAVRRVTAVAGSLGPQCVVWPPRTVAELLSPSAASAIGMDWVGCGGGSGGGSGSGGSGGGCWPQSAVIVPPIVIPNTFRECRECREPRVQVGWDCNLQPSPRCVPGLTAHFQPRGASVFQVAVLGQARRAWRCKNGEGTAQLQQCCGPVFTHFSALCLPRAG